MRLESGLAGWLTREFLGNFVYVDLYIVKIFSDFVFLCVCV